MICKSHTTKNNVSSWNMVTFIYLQQQLYLVRVVVRELILGIQGPKQVYTLDGSTYTHFTPSNLGQPISLSAMSYKVTTRLDFSIMLPAVVTFAHIFTLVMTVKAHVCFGLKQDRKTLKDLKDLHLSTLFNKSVFVTSFFFFFKPGVNAFISSYHVHYIYTKLYLFTCSIWSFSDILWLFSQISSVKKSCVPDDKKCPNLIGNKKE